MENNKTSISRIAEVKRKPGTMSSMAISFKSLDSDNADDDDYLNVFTVSKSPVKKESRPLDDAFMEPNVCIVGGNRKKESKSPIRSSSSMDETAFSKATRGIKSKLDKSSLISEIKGKLSDKFPDTYNAIAKKIEVLTNESPANPQQNSSVSKSSSEMESVSKGIGDTHELNKDSGTVDKVSANVLDGKDLIAEKLIDDCAEVLESNYVPLLNDSDETIEKNIENIDAISQVTQYSCEDIKEPISKIKPMNQDHFCTCEPVETSELFYDPLKNVSQIDDDSDEGYEAPPAAKKPTDLPIVCDYYTNDDSNKARSTDPPMQINNHALFSKDANIVTSFLKKRIRSESSDPVSLSSLMSSTSKNVNQVPIEDDLDKISELTEVSEELKSTTDHECQTTEKQEDILVSPPSENQVNDVPEPEMSFIEKLRDFSSFKMDAVHIINVAFLLLVYILLPLPSFVHGMTFGIVIASVVFYIKRILDAPRTRKPVTILPLDELAPMVVPEMKEPVKEDGKYSGWMNEVSKYNVFDYHINQTQSVLIRLDGTSIRLSTPETNIPKRVTYDEVIPHQTFIKERYFDMQTCDISLKPLGLIEKRIWSKKYPICLVFEVPMMDKTAEQENDSPKSDSKLKNSKVLLYLFARTGRDKEMWYHRFIAASQGAPLKNHLRLICKTLEFKQRRSLHDKHVRNMNEYVKKKYNKEASDAGTPDEKTPEASSPIIADLDVTAYAQYMARLMPSTSSQNSPTTPPSPLLSRSNKDNKDLQYLQSISCEPQLVWLNALLGRCFWEFLWTNYWADKVKNKIQKKLSKIKVPYFIEELQVTDIFLGTEMPFIRRAAKPYMDEEGFWVDLDIVYNGGFCMAVETKINLLRLKKQHERDKELTPVKSPSKAAHNEDEEDSAESSTDEEEETVAAEEQPLPGGGSGKSRGKIIRYIDKIAKSKYFQQAAEYKYIKKAMEEVSNTRMILNVVVKSLVGTLAVNIPPPPTDRLWYGFRGNPQLSLVAKPKVGTREVNVSHISEWIEKKLAIEFQRVFVMPNMDDIIIPLLMPVFNNDTQSSPTPANAHKESFS